MSNDVLIILGGILAFAIFCFYVLTVVHRRSGKLNREMYQKKWAEIETMAETEAGWVQAIIEADKLLDDALKKSGYKGKTMGERMVSASRAFSKKDSAWAAHKLRNKVVHETGVKLRQQHTKGALRSFRRALEDLGAL